MPPRRSPGVLGAVLAAVLAGPAAWPQEHRPPGPEGRGAAIAPGSEPTGAPPPETEIPPGLKEQPETQPWYVRAILRPRPYGMFIRLPIIDTDPNRGSTYGAMPIWVIQKAGRIRHIVAPSLTYNPIFKVSPTGRYYFYPTPTSSLLIRGSAAQVTDREALGEYEDQKFLGHDVMVGLRVHYNVDGSRRFFGVGADTPKKAESNYAQQTLAYLARAGIAVTPSSPWRVNVAHHLTADSIDGGPINALPDIGAAFPGFAPQRTRQSSALRLYLTRDTRDSQVTTRSGSYGEALAESSQRALGSQYVFQRFGLDLRRFLPHRGSRCVAAGHLKFEQVVGTAPFWLMPQLGGKYIHRAYGEGRFIERGLLAASVEERVKFYETGVGGVTTEFEVAPFAGLGAMFPTPGRMERRLFRPVFGGAVRAVARPQVVGSIDFGVGQEGLTAFMDINYSF